MSRYDDIFVEMVLECSLVVVLALNIGVGIFMLLR